MIKEVKPRIVRLADGRWQIRWKNNLGKLRVRTFPTRRHARSNLKYATFNLDQ